MGVTMEMFLPKTQILNKTPKPRNIKETKSSSLPTENSTFPLHRVATKKSFPKEKEKHYNDVPLCLYLRQDGFYSVK